MPIKPSTFSAEELSFFIPLALRKKVAPSLFRIILLATDETVIMQSSKRAIPIALNDSVSDETPSAFNKFVDAVNSIVLSCLATKQQLASLFETVRQ